MTKKPLPCPSEHQEQVAFVQWFRLQFPKVLIFAIPNGGQRNKIVAAKLKREGTISGVPDLYSPYFNLWIEMKRVKGGSLSKNQKEVIEFLEHSCGHVVIIAKGWKDGAKQVMQFLEKSNYV